MAPTLSLVAAATLKAAALACPRRRPAAASLAKRYSLTLRTHAAQPGGLVGLFALGCESILICRARRAQRIEQKSRCTSIQRQQVL